MAVAQIVGEGVEQGGLQPLGRLRRDAALRRQAVHLGEAQAEIPLQQEIGLGLDQFDGPVGILPPEGHAQGDGQAVEGEKLHQPPQPRLLQKAGLNGPGLFRRDAGHLGQAVGVGLDDDESLGPEGGDDALGRALAHALDGAGGEIGEDGVPFLGHGKLDGLRRELGTEGGMIHPAARSRDLFPDGDLGHLAHHGLTPLTGFDPENGIAILRVLIHHCGDGTLQQL